MAAAAALHMDGASPWPGARGEGREGGGGDLAAAAARWQRIGLGSSSGSTGGRWLTRCGSEPCCSGWGRASAAPGGAGFTSAGQSPPAPVQLENQRLREEIRAMCDTIKSQSSQLSKLWADPGLVSAVQKVGNDGAAVNGGTGLGGLDHNRLRLTGGVSDTWGLADRASESAASSDTGTAVSLGDTGKSHRSGRWCPSAPLLPAAPAESCVNGGAVEAGGGLVGVLGRYPSHCKLPLFTPTVSRPPTSVRQTPPACGVRAASQDGDVLPSPGVSPDRHYTAASSPERRKGLSGSAAQQGTVAVKFSVQRMNCALLAAIQGQRAAFEDAVKQALASEAGAGVYPEHVAMHVELPQSSTGPTSVEVYASLAPPGGYAASAAVRSRLAASHTLGRTVAARVARLDGVAGTAAGGLAVTNVRVTSGASSQSPPRSRGGSARAIPPTAARPTAAAAAVAGRASSSSEAPGVNSAPENVTFSLRVSNLEYDELAADIGLNADFQASLKLIVVQALDGQGDVGPEHVSLRLEKGSVLVQATVTPPSGGPRAAKALESKLRSVSTILQLDVAKRVGSIKGIQAIAHGPISVDITFRQDMSQSWASGASHPPGSSVASGWALPYKRPSPPPPQEGYVVLDDCFPERPPDTLDDGIVFGRPSSQGNLERTGEGTGPKWPAALIARGSSRSSSAATGVLAAARLRRSRQGPDGEDGTEGTDGSFRGLREAGSEDELSFGEETASTHSGRPYAQRPMSIAGRGAASFRTSTKAPARSSSAGALVSTLPTSGSRSAGVDSAAQAASHLRRDAGLAAAGRAGPDDSHRRDAGQATISSRASPFPGIVRQPQLPAASLAVGSNAAATPMAQVRQRDKPSVPSPAPPNQAGHTRPAAAAQAPSEPGPDSGAPKAPEAAAATAAAAVPTAVEQTTGEQTSGAFGRAVSGKDRAEDLTSDQPKLQSTQALAAETSKTGPAEPQQQQPREASGISHSRTSSNGSTQARRGGEALSSSAPQPSTTAETKPVDRENGNAARIVAPAGANSSSQPAPAALLPPPSSTVTAAASEEEPSQQKARRSAISEHRATQEEASESTSESTSESEAEPAAPKSAAPSAAPKAAAPNAPKAAAPNAPESSASSNGGTTPAPAATKAPAPAPAAAASKAAPAAKPAAPAAPAGPAAAPAAGAAANPKAVAPVTAPKVIAKGCTLRIVGLKMRPDFNGLKVKCDGWDDKENRWVVIFPDDSRKRLKPDNLELVETEESSSEEEESEEESEEDEEESGEDEDSEESDEEDEVPPGPAVTAAPSNRTRASAPPDLLSPPAKAAAAVPSKGSGKGGAAPKAGVTVGKGGAAQTTQAQPAKTATSTAATAARAPGTQQQKQQQKQQPTPPEADDDSEEESEDESDEEEETESETEEESAPPPRPAPKAAAQGGNGGGYKPGIKPGKP